MSSNIDPAKLKVADLRNELSARGLDVKGTKPVLVKRLKDALEKEINEEIPDTSIADTSTEEEKSPRKSLRGSTDEKEEARPTRSAPTVTPVSPEKPKPTVKSPEKVDKPPQEKPSPKPAPQAAPSVKKPEVKNAEVKASPIKVPEKPAATSPEKSKAPEVKSPEKPKVETKSPVKAKQELEKEEELSDKKAKLDQENGEEDKEKAKMEVEEESDKTAKAEGDENKTEDVETENEQKGEKRKRSTESPERASKRPRTPIREDEPEIDAEAVLLSWYDSDLNLQVDKTTFLSAKPLTDGAFGYIWAGARATHGASSGKVCFEVKITEKIKWEEFYRPESKDNRFRTDHRRSRRDDRRHSKKDDDKSKSDSEKSKDDTDKTSEDSEKPKGEANDDSEKPKEDADKISDDSEQLKEDADKTNDDSEKKQETKESMDVSVNEKEEKTDKMEATKSDEAMETAESDEKNVEENGEKKDDNEEEKSKDEKKEKDEELPPLPTHFMRIGWSVASSSLQLGEDKNSYAYESSGKIVKDKEFSDYGITFEAGDVVGAYLDISDISVTIQFTVNDKLQPSFQIAITDLPEDFVLYPHVLSRNYSFELNFGEKEEPWFAIPEELAGYQYIGKFENKVAGMVRPENRSDCEVLLMFGLPASGKTDWVKKHLTSNPDKNYTVLGNSSIMERMTISGETLKSKYRGKWGILVDRVQKCLNRLVSTAAQRRRNYIIDQTNVFPSAQRRKLRPFEGFKRKAVIVVNGDEEQARRQGLQEALEGKEVPDSTLLEMKAAISLPEIGEWLEEVVFVGIEEEEAKDIIKKYNAAGKAAGYGPEKRFNRDRWNYNRRTDYRGGRNFQRQGGGGYNRQPYPQNRWGPPRHGGSSGGGGWKQDSRSRDWRAGGGGGGYERRDRDYYSQGSYSNRNQSSGNRTQGSGQRWGGSSGGGGGGWGGQGWNQQNFGNRNYWGNQGGGGGGQGGWGKYGSSGSGSQGQGQNYGYGNWNYYGQQGQQSQNWGGQGQQQAGYGASSNTAAQSQAQTQGQYAQAYSTQEAWAQYAKQYAQHQQMAQNQAAASAQKR